MKLLLDECVDHELRHDIVGHDVYSVVYMGWAGTKNGQLLSLAGAAGFDALVTTDRAMATQQNPATLPLAVVILHAPTNDISDVRPLVPALLAALATLAPRRFVHIPCP